MLVHLEMCAQLLLRLGVKALRTDKAVLFEVSLLDFDFIGRLKSRSRLAVSVGIEWTGEVRSLGGWMVICSRKAMDVDIVRCGL